ELGPVVPRTFPPAPGWSASGHRIKAPLDYSRGPEKIWVYGALRVCDGKELTRCTASRNSTTYIALNADEIEQATSITTAQLNRRANPWIWGRSHKEHRHSRQLFFYRL